MKKTLLALSVSILATSPLQAEDSKQVSQTVAEPSKAPWLVFNQQPENVIPNPLTLESVLNELPRQSASELLAQAQLMQREAQILSTHTDTAFKLSLYGRLGKREFNNETQNNHMLALHFQKVLYDFGRTALKESAAQNLKQAQEFSLTAIQRQQRMSLMQRYFDVILADFQYRIDNEAMAIEYIAFDKSKDRHALGRISDVKLLEVESRYQQALLKRQRSEQNRFKSRLMLANELGFSEARPDQLVVPKLAVFKERNPKQLKLETLQKEVVENHPLMQSFKLQWQAQMDRVVAARATSKPTIAAEGWLGPMSSYPETREGNWRADLTMSVPLIDGGLTDASIAKAQAKLLEIQAQSEQLAQRLREQVTEVYFQIMTLETERKQHVIFGDYADLYLDLSRALYENEEATDLGNSMVRLSQANYNLVEWRFKQAVLWTQLDHLLGQDDALTQVAE